MIKLLTVQFSPVSSHLLQFRPKYLPYHSVPKHHGLDMTDRVSHSYKYRGNMYSVLIICIILEFATAFYNAMHIIFLLHRQHIVVFPVYLL